MAQPLAFGSQYKIIRCSSTKTKLSVIKVHLQNNQDHNHLKLLQTNDVTETGRGRERSRDQVSLEFLQLVLSTLISKVPSFFWVSGNLSLAIMNHLTRSDNLLYSVLSLQAGEALHC